jgi:pimeloyl-ACP methyl ester carboxylesterase
MTTHRIPGLVLTDHEFLIPLDHARQDGERITVFAREVVSPDKEHKDLPWLLFLQGGPGFGAPRPENANGWLKRALKDYRVLLLDQRGTGLSTPVLTQTLACFNSHQEQFEYLKHFRADAIVLDAEWIRKQLIGQDGQWSVLGQSYGGFCAVHYLSTAGSSLREVIITGGLPPLTQHPDEIYHATYRRVIEKNQKFYQRYPDDISRAQLIVQYLNTHEIRLPNGDRLTPNRFQQLGIAFGASNGYEQVHYLLEDAFVQAADGLELSLTFLRGFENAQAFETNPIYAILHEPIYSQGFASKWSAHRVREQYPEFEIATDKPIYFTGEMIYPWMFDEYKHLRPLKEAAELLANYDGWPVLYDIPSLNNNRVPVVASVYYNDMYVERIISEQTAKEINGLRLWVTNEYEHSALRLHGEQLLDHLLKMLQGEL